MLFLYVKVKPKQCVFCKKNPFLQNGLNALLQMAVSV